MSIIKRIKGTKAHPFLRRAAQTQHRFSEQFSDLKRFVLRTRIARFSGTEIILFRVLSYFEPQGKSRCKTTVLLALSGVVGGVEEKASNRARD